jgi:hypothetical protein
VISADLEDPGSLLVGQQMVSAGDRPGIRRTANRGASWSDGSHGLAGLFAGPVGVRGSRSFLAGNQRTNDSGNRWTAFLPGRPVQDLAVDPAHPETIYAATGAGPDILWKSGDGGATWRPASIGLLPTSIGASLAIDPRRPEPCSGAHPGPPAFSSRPPPTLPTAEPHVSARLALAERRARTRHLHLLPSHSHRCINS